VPDFLAIDGSIQTTASFAEVIFAERWLGALVTDAFLDG
jgi:hypothetical protein